MEHAMFKRPIAVASFKYCISKSPPNRVASEPLTAPKTSTLNKRKNAGR